MHCDCYGKFFLGVTVSKVVHRLEIFTFSKIPNVEVASSSAALQIYASGTIIGLFYSQISAAFLTIFVTDYMLLASCPIT